MSFVTEYLLHLGVKERKVLAIARRIGEAESRVPKAQCLLTVDHGILVVETN